MLVATLARAPSARAGSIDSATVIALRRGVKRWARDARNEIDEDELEAAARSRNVAALADAFFSASGAFAAAWSSAAPKLAQVVGQAERRRVTRAVAKLNQQLEIPARTQRWIVTHRASLVREVSEEARAGLAASIDAAVSERLTRKELSARVKPQIGLLERDVRAVETMRKELTSSGAADVDGQCARYAEKLLNRRAENIGRTETIAIQGAAQHEEWRAMRDEGLLGVDARRLWIASSDACRFCLELNGQKVGLDDTFVSSKYGGVLRQPLHPSCTCSVTLSFD